MSGKTLTGFAHGVAGIVYFLCEYARRFKDAEAARSWQKGANWLLREARKTNIHSLLEWSYSTDEENYGWKWWCHGSPGIALTFLRLFENTKKTKYAIIADRCLRVHPFEFRYSNLSQCHGLSGLGEIYLEAYRVLKHKKWYDRAKRIADLLISLSREQNKHSLTWLVEGENFPTADLMIGSGGIIHFLLKFAHSKHVGCRLLLDPL